MQTIPLNVAEPLMRFDVFGIVGIHVATGVVLVAMRASGLIFGLVAFRAEPLTLLLNNTSYEVLASLANERFVRKGECIFVVLGMDQAGPAEMWRWLTIMFNFVCCLPPSSARNGVWP